MKNLTKMAGLAILMTAFTLTSNAQNTATSAATTAGATIVAPITISAGSLLSFGQVVTSAAPGEVILTSAGSRSAANGVSFSGVTGSPSASVFTVTGETGYTYTITLPTSIDLDGTTGAALAATASMTVDSFTKSIATGDLSDDGTEDFSVGATLHVGASQPTGAYEGTYTVQVDYQ